LLPIQRGSNDGVQIVEPWLPAELGPDAVGSRHERRGVARAAGLFSNIQRMAGDSLYALENFPHAIAVSVTHVENDRGAAISQIRECVEMRCGEIFDMNVITNSGSVRCRVVRAVN
jgi:hypothetical protein